MKNCANCRHWYQSAADKAAAQGVGQCRAMPPATSFSWPRTRTDEFCSLHAARQGVQTEFDAGASAPSPHGDPEHRAAPPLEAPKAAPEGRGKGGPRLRQRI